MTRRSVAAARQATPARTDANFTFGLEEEYFLVDLRSRDLVISPPSGLMADCRRLLGDRVHPEFLRCQIEVATAICRTADEARGELRELRRTVAACAAEYGLAPVAASTHPFADWYQQLSTEKARYARLESDLQAVIRRRMVCGLHVHVAVEPPPLRFELFQRVIPFLPYFLALSASSPFWRGEPTGISSYRLSVLNDAPRTALPPSFRGIREYDRAVQTLVDSGQIADATMIWWDVRPSARFPTLELRINDVCTRLDDAAAIASLYRCTLRMLARLRRGSPHRGVSPMLVDENRWLAQRDGSAAALIDYAAGAKVGFAQIFEAWMELIGEDAAALGAEREIAHARRIVREGTSARRQLTVFEAAVAAGETSERALKAVVDHLISETVEGCDSVTSPRARSGRRTVTGVAPA
jgi:carboxylate-amine ligase